MPRAGNRQAEDRVHRFLPGAHQQPVDRRLCHQARLKPQRVDDPVLALVDTGGLVVPQAFGAQAVEAEHQPQEQHASE